MIVFSWSRARSVSAPTGCARCLDRRRLRRRLRARLDGLVRLEPLDAPVAGPVAAAGLLRHALGALLDLISQHGDRRLRELRAPRRELLHAPPRPDALGRRAPRRLQVRARPAATHLAQIDDLGTLQKSHLRFFRT